MAQDHYSIKIETLGKRWNAAVMAIGVQQFDIATGKMGQTFYKEIQLASALRSGGITADTLQFWMEQSDESRRIFKDNENKLHLADALLALTTWLRGMPNSITVWGNGPVFDVGILEHAYDVGSVGVKEPWKHWNIRDMRTIVDAAEYDWKSDPNQTNALKKATAQAQAISLAWQRIKRGLALLKADVAAKAAVEDDDL